MDSVTCSVKSYRFDKPRRLSNKVEYENVFKQSYRIMTAEFIVLHKLNTVQQGRLGLAISKKMLSKAHERNRIKRILRESFRTRDLPSVDLVFLAKKGLAKKSNTILFDNLSLIWDKLATFYAK